MSKTAWPTTNEVTDYLTGLGVTTIPTGVTVADSIEVAVAALEEIVGVTPYLTDTSGVAVDYKYDPPRTHMLDLGAPFAGIDDVAVAGSTLTLNSDYWLIPTDAPYRFVEFATRQYGDPQTVVVTGFKGIEDIPTDLWGAVRDYATAQVYRVAAIAGTVGSGMMTKVKQGMREVEYSASKDAKAVHESLMDSALAVFNKYRVKSVGGLQP